MTSPCDTVADRLALGEPLSDEQQAHVTRCAGCARLAGVPRLLAAAAEDPEPGPGFSARMTLGARTRLAERRRNRLIATTVAAAAVVAVGGIAVTRPDRDVTVGAIRTIDELEPHPQPPPVIERAAAAGEEIVLDLVRVADVDRALEGSAAWSEIAEPLLPYRALLESRRDRKGDRR
jgi:hypothetical protein